MWQFTRPMGCGASASGTAAVETAVSAVAKEARKNDWIPVDISLGNIMENTDFMWFYRISWEYHGRSLPSGHLTNCNIRGKSVFFKSSIADFWIYGGYYVSIWSRFNHPQWRVSTRVDLIFIMYSWIVSPCMGKYPCIWGICTLYIYICIVYIYIYTHGYPSRLPQQYPMASMDIGRDYHHFMGHYCCYHHFSMDILTYGYFHWRDVFFFASVDTGSHWSHTQTKSHGDHHFLSTFFLVFLRSIRYQIATSKKWSTDDLWHQILMTSSHFLMLIWSCQMAWIACWNLDWLQCYMLSSCLRRTSRYRPRRPTFHVEWMRIWLMIWLMLDDAWGYGGWCLRIRLIWRLTLTKRLKWLGEVDFEVPKSKRLQEADD